ncbi:hypothetical protein EHS13_31530 [Paenibacillus psychroresistens]|uniref:Uncharacterized protein n=1 Tax=Paenibacillus psychroresistens TaxID=1778678 RepID=A0A6B8RT50_9BACL|nr:DUF6220 domain-containing protein [Paenibacillus psychroresistens]QGQ99089.1 hypothetical protein EHS13_31530 [Paenibacillus psychroresistens]
MNLITGSKSTRKAMIVLKWMAWVFAAGIILQVFLAGLALFVDTDNWAAHASFPRYFAFLPIFMILLSFIMRLPLTYRVQSIRLFIMVAATFATAILSSKIGYLSALHPVIAVALFMSAMSLARNANLLLKQEKV